MKKILIYVAITCFSQYVSAQTLVVNTTALESLELASSYCKSGKNKNFWMKVDGELVELGSQRNAGVSANDLKARQWLGILKDDEVTVSIHWVDAKDGKDSTTFDGAIDVRRGSIKKHFQVVGGCNT